MRLDKWCQTVIPRDGFFYLSLIPMIFLHTFHFWKWVFDNAVTLIADICHIVMTIPWRLVTSLLSVTSTLTMAYCDVLYNQCISNTWKFSIFIFPKGLIRVCEIRFASTGVICGNPYAVCKKLEYGKKDIQILEQQHQKKVPDVMCTQQRLNSACAPQSDLSLHCLHEKTLHIATDKALFHLKNADTFLIFSTKTYVVVLIRSASLRRF